MTIVSLLARHRRVLVLCAATVALHYAAIDWVGGRLSEQTHRPSERKPSLMTAQLRLALPKRVEMPPPPQIAPLAKKTPPPRKAEAPPFRPRPAPMPLPDPAPLPEPDPAAVAAEVPSLLAGEPPIAVADGGAQGGQQAAQQAGAAQAQTGTPPPAGAQGDRPAEVKPDASPRPGMRRYKVDLPPSATFQMAVDRVDADGTKWTGAATMTWHTDGSRYQASVQAGVSLLITRLNLLTSRSEGEIDDYGIAPVKWTEKRARRAETATHFNRDAGTITFSASEASFPLLVGAQDRVTVPFQLGGIGRADVNQFGGDIDIQVADDKEATINRFQLVGEEEIDTGNGKVVTWHLTRPAKAGAYSSKLEIWLAPGLNWYPLRIRVTEGSGAVTTQTVSDIKTEAGK
ncbi:hypothetical protein FHW58_004665 [Duganella sp. 1224]|uniref:DUF3108 domain-containing protein n=1 Tax=Duganella sp. 1224 TaxID=2587052 RepID=UPI0015CC92F0|nr:DUF3108 domain-containing protein [Duganella sp. 1224]NYE63435.1 hypothetical protein [Duganella sp. 1224]